MNNEEQQIDAATSSDIKVPLMDESPSPSPKPRVSSEKSVEVRKEKSSETTDFSHITNADFINAVFQKLPEGASVAVCSKNGDPTVGGWVAEEYDKMADQLSPNKNCYVSCSSFYRCEDGSFNVKKAQFTGYHCIMLDDVGTKVDEEKFVGIEPSWKLETSPGNYQIGFIFAEPITDIEKAEQLINAIMAAGLSDKGAGGVSRWARLPNAINGKPKHLKDGEPFHCRLVEWSPENRYTITGIVDGLKLELSPKKERSVPKRGNVTTQPSENPVIAALKERGLYKRDLGDGKHDITCPRVEEHTDQLDDGTAYFEPSEEFPDGGIRCHHSHGDEYHIRNLHEDLGVDHHWTDPRPLIQIFDGGMDRFIEGAEKALADHGGYFHSGGLIVAIVGDPITGDPSIASLNNANNLTKVLCEVATFEKYDRRTKELYRCDPPPRHVSVLFESSEFKHLLPLAGLAHQPYFHEGELITTPGYNPDSKLFGVFDPDEFELLEPTLEQAQKSLILIQDLLNEFSFLSPIDFAATISAILTAVVRASIDLAPGFHVHASTIASGKSYLCELIAAFTGSGDSEKTSYPKTADEATKVILALLLRKPGCVEFDDMDSGWKPFSVIKRVLTAKAITERILGVSKTATVTTRTLLLGSGNNNEPERDLRRRVATIKLDPRMETPAIRKYDGDPVAEVKDNRGKYVMAALNIIQAWQVAGKPKSDIDSIASYNGEWSDYCRHPLVWLGLPDPASILIEQIVADPDKDSLRGLLKTWYAAFGSTPTTVRKALASMEPKSLDFNDCVNQDLYDAMCEFPIEERNGINRSKLGWLLKKNANRIVDGLEFRTTTADGRTAWQVVEVKTNE